MGNKVWVSGLTIMLAFPELFPAFPETAFFGAFVMIIGAVLICLDK